MLPVLPGGMKLNVFAKGEFRMSSRIVLPVRITILCSLILGLVLSSFPPSNAGQSSRVSSSLSGTPKITVSPMSINFGSVRTGGMSSPHYVKIKNTGKADLIITSITIIGPNAFEFRQSNTCTSISSGSSCNVNVTFSPQPPFGAKTVALVISSNDANKTVIKVKLQGKALADISGSWSSYRSTKGISGEQGPDPSTLAQTGKGVAGIFGGRHFVGTINGLNLTGYMTNNDATMETFSGSVSPDGNTMSGTWMSGSNGRSGVWRATRNYPPLVIITGNWNEYHVENGAEKGPDLCALTQTGNGIAGSVSGFPVTGTISGLNIGLYWKNDSGVTTFLTGNMSTDGPTTSGTYTDSSGKSGTWRATKNITPSEFPIADNPDTVTYIDQELSSGAAFDGTNYLVGIQERILSKAGDAAAASRYIEAQLVSQTGSAIGPRITVPNHSGGLPDVAFDGTNYFLTWEEDITFPYDHIYGQFISKTGTLVGSAFAISSTADGSAQVRHTLGKMVIFDGTNYFVVWENRSNADSADTADVYGQFVTPAGVLLGSSIPVSTAAHGQLNPTLAFDGNGILIVWVDGRNQSACYTDTEGTHCVESDIAGQFVTKSSADAAGDLYGGNFAINTSLLSRDNPSVAFDGTNYFVMFNEETTLPNACPSIGCVWNIFGQLVTKAGAPTGPKITFSSMSASRYLPLVTWGGTHYLATWTENPGTSSTSVKGSYISASGAVSSEFLFFSPSSDGRVPWFVSPIYNGTNYFIVVDRGTPGTGSSNFETYTNQGVLGTFVNP